MLIPRYWTRVDGEAEGPGGERQPYSIWRGSRQSLEESRRLAREAAEKLASRIRNGNELPHHYSYGDRPVREEILDEIPSDSASPVQAIITRNLYGSLILNTAQLGFIDVDLPVGRPPSFLTRLSCWFRGTAPMPPPDPSDLARQRLRQWIDDHPDWSVRVYRTHSGLRYMVTHTPLEPGQGISDAVMEFVGADPQYQRLCRVQKSFRARLTPKPWRCRLPRPPARYPWDSEKDEQAMRAWEKRYVQAAMNFATCELIETLGTSHIAPELAPFVQLHDRYTRADSGAALA